MKAAQVSARGDTTELALVDLPRPDVGPDQALVRVCGAGVNPLDAKIRFGLTPKNLSVRLPFVLGGDISGIVEQVGALVRRVKPGDRVFGRTHSMAGGGFAEFTAIRSDALAFAPETIPLVHAAGIPAAAGSAWAALFDLGRLRAGQSVLIHAAAGGVGSFAVQLAKLAGARVAATCSKANFEMVRSLGADELIDYNVEDFSSRLRGLDLVLDSIGGETEAKSLQVIRPDGMLVGLVRPPDEARARQSSINSRFLILDQIGNNGARLQDIANLIDAGALRLLVNKEIAFEQLDDALQLSRTGRVSGKIVVRISDE